jgi:hypothetical protein
MRVAFGVLSLLLVVVIVAMLARKQLGAIAPAAAPSPASSLEGASPVPAGTPRQQVQQYQQAIQGAMQPARPVLEDK